MIDIKEIKKIIKIRKKILDFNEDDDSLLYQAWTRVDFDDLIGKNIDDILALAEEALEKRENN